MSGATPWANESERGDYYAKECDRLRGELKMMKNAEKTHNTYQEYDSDENVIQVFPKVRLIAHTNDPLLTTNIAARRCYSPFENDELIETTAELDEAELGTFINGVMKSGHMSTVEHTSFTFMVEGVSRDMMAQITRSRIASFSVQSQRYVDFENGFTYIMPTAVEELGDDAMAEYAAQMCTIHHWYRGWINMGLKPEDARYVLPGAAETKFVVTMNARELIHFLQLRCCNRAQWEIRYIANEMLDILQRSFPVLFDKAGPTCVYTGKCPEGKRGCGQRAEMKAEYEARTALNKIVRGKGDAE